jgi:hypothetical protein
MKTLAGDLKGARFALWKNPEDLSANQAAKLAWIQKTNQRLYRAYLMKEQLRQVFRLRGAAGIALLKEWLAWTSRSKIAAFVELARTIRKHRAAIEGALTHGLTNARVESVNTKIRLLQRVAFGYRDPEALIAMAMLDLGGCCPALPGRAACPSGGAAPRTPRCRPSASLRVGLSQAEHPVTRRPAASPRALPDPPPTRRAVHPARTHFRTRIRHRRGGRQRQLRDAVEPRPTRA